MLPSAPVAIPMTGVSVRGTRPADRRSDSKIGSEEAGSAVEPFGELLRDLPDGPGGRRNRRMRHGE
jgi:hypothetical protein